MEEMLKNKAGRSDLGAGVKIAIAFFGGIVTLVVLGFVLIVLAGNLEGSTGLTTGSLADNMSTNMLNNVTSATADFFSNATTWFTLLSIVIIIATVVIVLVMTKKARGGGSYEA